MAHSLRAAAVGGVVSAAILGAVLVLIVRDRDATVAAYAARLHAVEAEAQACVDHVAGLQAEVDGLARRIEESYQPVEVGGRLDLPIHRAFARPGDTLSAIAGREGTTVAILRALNPWLGEGDVALQDRQSLWIPKPAGE